MMKKIFTIILASILVFSLSSFVFADDSFSFKCSVCGVPFVCDGDYVQLASYPDSYSFMKDVEGLFCMIYPEPCCPLCTGIQAQQMELETITKTEINDALVPDSTLLRPSDFSVMTDYYQYLVDEGYMSADAYSNYLTDIALQSANKADYLLGSPDDISSLSSEMAEVSEKISSIDDSLGFVLGNSPIRNSQVTGFSLSASEGLSSGLKEIILSLIGDYEPFVVTVDTEVINADGSISSGVDYKVQPDFAWIASFLMLALVVLSVFKMGGALFCRM